jgi:hypothetical protein
MEYSLYDFHQGGAGKPNKEEIPIFIKYPQLPTLKFPFKFSISKKLENYFKHWSFEWNLSIFLLF